MFFWKQGLIYLEKQVCIFAKYIQEFYLFLNAVRRGGAMMSKICAQANRCASYMRPVADKTPESISVCSQKYKKTCIQDILATLYSEDCLTRIILWLEMSLCWILKGGVHLRFRGCMEVYYAESVVYFERILYFGVHWSVFCRRRPFSNRNKHKSSKSCRNNTFSAKCVFRWIEFSG